MKAEVMLELSGVSKYNFTNDNGEEVKGCKLSYHIDNLDDNNLGSKSISLNCDYKFFSSFQGCRFPVRTKLTLDLSDLSKRPNILDVNVIK